MVCQKCGKEFKEGIFCPECGTKAIEVDPAPNETGRSADSTANESKNIKPDTESSFNFKRKGMIREKDPDVIPWYLKMWFISLALWAGSLICLGPIIAAVLFMLRLKRYPEYKKSAIKSGSIQAGFYAILLYLFFQLSKETNNSTSENRQASIQEESVKREEENTVKEESAELNNNETKNAKETDQPETVQDSFDDIKDHIIDYAYIFETATKKAWNTADITFGSCEVGINAPRMKGGTYYYIDNKKYEDTDLPRTEKGTFFMELKKGKHTLQLQKKSLLKRYRKKTSEIEFEVTEPNMEYVFDVASETLVLEEVKESDMHVFEGCGIETIYQDNSGNSKVRIAEVVYNSKVEGYILILLKGDEDLEKIEKYAIAGPLTVKADGSYSAEVLLGEDAVFTLRFDKYVQQMSLKVDSSKSNYYNEFATKDIYDAYLLNLPVIPAESKQEADKKGDPYSPEAMTEMFDNINKNIEEANVKNDIEENSDSAPEEPAYEEDEVYTEGDPGDVLFEIKVSASDGGVNLRSGPGTNYDILISMIPNGTELLVSEETKNESTGTNWYYTWYNGKEGWVSAKAVSVMRGADFQTEDYIVEGSDSGYFDRSYFEKMTDAELRLARNEIFARHGRKFDATDLQSYFDSKSWYHPKYEPAEFDAIQDDILNQWEKANRDVIKEIEASRK